MLRSCSLRDSVIRYSGVETVVIRDSVTRYFGVETVVIRDNVTRYFGVKTVVLLQNIPLVTSLTSKSMTSQVVCLNVMI